MADTEIGWTMIPGFPGYSIDRTGSVLGPSGKVLRQNHKKSGHAYIAVRGSGLRKNMSIHRALWTAFVGPIPQGMEMRHLNGKPADNQIANLAVGDRFDQRADDRRNGVVRSHRGLALDEDKVAAIIQAKGVSSSRFVAARFGVSHTTIQKIWRNERWLSVPR